MSFEGNLVKMNSRQEGHKVSYLLRLGENEIDISGLIGKKLSLRFQHKINCINCGKETRKSFGQGFCYQCFTTAPEADECILRPDRCMAHLGISRDMNWSEEHCLQPHIVYLALSGGLKVGVTRLSQVPTRWIDQGAEKAIRICQVPNRHIAGVVEKYLMKYFDDKTNWKKMVTNELLPAIDLVDQKKKALNLLPAELRQYATSDEEVFHFDYPVEKWPQKPVQHNFDKSDELTGVLNGIRGQYLFFEGQEVLNIRRFSGYRITLELD